MTGYWKQRKGRLARRSLMIKFDWFEDSWNDIETEDGEILDTNLWTCDTSEKQYISFYRTFTNDKGYRETKATKPIATYRVIKEGKPE